MMAHAGKPEVCQNGIQCADFRWRQAEWVGPTLLNVTAELPSLTARRYVLLISERRDRNKIQSLPKTCF